jgi:ABC-type amino acid transport substrate-binding protein
MNVRIASFIVGLLIAGGVQAQPAVTLKKIADSKSIVLGYRTEAAPFSFAGPDGQPAGYSVDLCKRVVAGLERQLKLSGLAVKWVPVTADNRIGQVTGGSIDLECGITTVTLGRLEQVDFSSLIFVDGASFVSAGAGPRTVAELAGKRVGVLSGSTTEPRLRSVLKERKIDAQVIVMRDDREVVAALSARKIDAFANDRLALIGRVLIGTTGGEFTLADEDISFEPYALMMRRDAAFRLAVNRALAQIYSGQQIVEVYNRWFSELGRPGPLLASMYYLNALGE